MLARDGVFLEDLCPKSHVRRWRRTLHQLTGRRCLYCGQPSQSIDHVHPQSRGGLSVTENCVPACLSCNGSKGDSDAFLWYRQQKFYDPRRAMALRAWTDGDLRLAERLLTWSRPAEAAAKAPAVDRASPHQTRQATSPLWRWQMAS
ncbi:MAG: HNH endonuclease [Cyanobacteriota bacterium]